MKYIGLNSSRIKVLWNWAQRDINKLTSTTKQYFYFTIMAILWTYVLQFNDDIEYDWVLSRTYANNS